MKVQITNRLEESDINVFIKMANENNRSLNYIFECISAYVIDNKIDFEKMEKVNIKRNKNKK